MTVDYDRRIARARELATGDGILEFYAGLAEIQREIFHFPHAKSHAKTHAIVPSYSHAKNYVSHAGPDHLRTFLQDHLTTDAEVATLLDSYWHGDRSGSAEYQFFARVLLQPFAEALALRAVPQESATNVCPFCASKPGVGVLRGEGDGGKRSLICSLCSTEWVYRRIVCPNCNEENKDRLPIYTVEQYPFLRVDACDTCHTYLKSVDLTKHGLAVPIVDEIATVALNIWAEERGYTKLEVNLLGM